MAIYPINNRFPVKIKTLLHERRGYYHHYGVNDNTLAMEGEAIRFIEKKIYQKHSKHSDDIFISNTSIGSDRYFYAMNGNNEFEGEMIFTL